GLPLRIPLFLACGKLISVKRTLDVVQAFAQVRRTLPSGLVIVGTGVLESAIRTEVSRLGLDPDVKMLGFRNQGDLPAVYSACDVLVLASSREPWGLVVNEAMAAGLAVAVSDQVGAGPDLVDVDNGFAFPLGDGAALARGLLQP